MTKREIFENILQYVETDVMEIDKETLRAFATRELDSLDKRLATDRKRNEAKKEAGDLLTKAIQNVLTTEPQTANEIIEQLEDQEDLTPSKIAYRMRPLIEDNSAMKVKISVKDEETNKTRQLTAYRLP